MRQFNVSHWTSCTRRIVNSLKNCPKFNCLGFPTKLGTFDGYRSHNERMNELRIEQPYWRLLTDWYKALVAPGGAHVPRLGDVRK